MKGGAHVVVGAATGWLALWALHSSGVALGPDVLIAGALVAAVGALMPDIDHPRSTVSRRVPRRLVREAARVVLPLAAVVAVSLALGGRDAADKLMEAGEPLLRLVGLLVLPAAVLMTVSLLVSRTFGHRGATHSLVFAAAAGLIAAALCARFALSPWYGALFGLGWLSHLAADATGRRGLPSLLWPLSGRR